MTSLSIAAASQRAAIVRELVRLGERWTTGVAYREGAWILFELSGERECVATDDALALLSSAPFGGLWAFLEGAGCTR